jgi:CO dehydrogenase maturation factor
MRTIVSTGRGGTGKTTFIALLTKYWIKKKSLLLVDIDPDENLAEMVGIDLQKEGIKTISDILFDIQKGRVDDELKSLPRPVQIEYMFHLCLYEGDGFDLFSLGAKWTEGCYCQPNNILKSIIPKLSKNYDYTLIDSPAGLEHLNRKIMSEIDSIVAIVDPSKKSFHNARRSLGVAREIGIKFKDFYVVSNYRFSNNLEGSIKELGLKHIGKIDRDENVEECILEGKSLLGLPEDSPAFLSVKKIIENMNAD